MCNLKHRHARDKLRYKERTGARQGSGELGVRGRGKGLRSVSELFHSSHRDVKCSVWNIVSNVVITLCGVRWLLDSSGVTW